MALRMKLRNRIVLELTEIVCVNFDNKRFQQDASFRQYTRDIQA